MNLWTIGFTRTSAERFFGQVGASGAKRLVDVRLKNVSQLSGFAKRDDLAYFLRTICDMTVGIEFEGFSVPPPYGHDYVYSPAQPWPEPMITAGISIHQWFFEQVSAIAPSASTIIGHREIAPQTRAYDPGGTWPQERIISTCRRAAPAPGPRSPDLTLAQALEAMVEAFPRPGGDVALTPLPEEDDAHVYELRIARA